MTLDFSVSAYDSIDEKYKPTEKEFDQAAAWFKDLGNTDAQDYAEYINDSANHGDPDQVLKCWQASGPVVLLSAFLKEYQEYGITLEMSQAKPVLCFDPGLKPKTANPERWSIAVHAMALIDAARVDLETLLSNDLLRLKQHKNIWI